MSRPRRFAAMIAALLGAAALLSLFFSHRFHYSEGAWAGDPFAGRQIRCCLNIGRADDSTRVLITGYNYELLQRFAADIGSTACILPVRDTAENPLDSLLQGRLDILVLPCRKGVDAPRGTLSQVVLDSLSVWLVREDNLHGLRDIRAWMRRYERTALRAKLDSRYVQAIYDPFLLSEAGRTRTELSPYDSLYKAYAPRLGWDWRMLAALSFKESKFRIDAQSHKNAFGLMQVGAATAARYGLEDPMEPEGNIRAGVTYLGDLQGFFANKAGSQDDLTAMVLAAYNGGEGRVLDCIDFAAQLSAYDSTWACLQRLPEMAFHARIRTDTLDMHKYDLGQISRYVDDVLDTYGAFRSICP